MRIFTATVTFLFLTLPPVVSAQHEPITPEASASDEGASHRTRLYLKDGTYQLVLSYKVQGNLVVYRSAERAGQTEEIPLNLVDLQKTQAWAQANDPTVPKTPILDPELAREEKDRAERSPEIATDLHLSEQDSVFALDVYHGTPNLVPLTQTEGDLNRQTAHNILRQTLNPFAHAHQLVQIKGQKASAQMHVPDPEFYVRLDDTSPQTDDSASSFTVDTHGASSVAGHTASSPESNYVIVQVDVRQDIRVVSSFSINMLGSGELEQDVVETERTILPGGHWMKIKPKRPLLFGEYALIEVLNGKEINLSVWDFGVHPTAPANRDAILPQPRKKPTLGPRQ